MAPYQPLGMELEFHFSKDQDIKQNNNNNNKITIKE